MILHSYRALFEDLLEMVNGIEVWQLCWSVKNLDLLGVQPLLGFFGGIFQVGVIILLEDNALLRDFRIFHGRK